MMQKKALVTGVTGQDGAYLAKFLIEKNYMVYGAYRRVSTNNLWRLEELDILAHPNFQLVALDLTDLASCMHLTKHVQPSEVYNLAAQSFVDISFQQPVTTTQVTAIGPLNLLEAIRIVDPKIRFYQASSSEMFGKVQAIPQNETTPFYPRSPYGVAKLYAHWITVNYHESYDIFACSGILFNHESPLRGEEFVTRKITLNLARIALGKQEYFELGNLDAKRDWGFAGDYVEGIWKILQDEKANNYILATNRTSTIREFLSLACKCANIDAEFQGSGIDEILINRANGKTIMRINPKYYRPAEVDLLIGDSSKAKKQLGWEATTTVEQLCTMMFEADYNRVARKG